MPNFFITVKFPMQQTFKIHAILKSLIAKFPRVRLKVSWERLSPDLHIILISSPEVMNTFRQSFGFYDVLVQKINDFRLKDLVSKFMVGKKAKYTQADRELDADYRKKYKLVNYNKI